jgi:hypothetical protein
MTPQSYHPPISKCIYIRLLLSLHKQFNSRLLKVPNVVLASERRMVALTNPFLSTLMDLKPKSCPLYHSKTTMGRPWIILALLGLVQITVVYAQLVIEPTAQEVVDAALEALGGTGPISQLKGITFHAPKLDSRSYIVNSVVLTKTASIDRDHLCKATTLQ